MTLELNYKESNANNTDTHIYDTYWENKPNVNNNKKVTYDDILSTLNLVVSRDGVLRKMSHNSDINSVNRNGSVINSVDDYGNNMNDNKTSNNFENKGFQPAQFRKRSPEALTKSVTLNNNNNVIETELKNSAIFNKYFKDYKDPNTKILPRRPLTKEEYKQKIIEDIIQQRRISKIKSKKLAFTNNNNNLIHIKPKSYQNHLFNFSK